MSKQRAKERSLKLESKSRTLFCLPQAYYQDVSQIPFTAYYQLGYRVIFFDIDNTLLPHGSQQATAELKIFLKNLQASGFSCYLFSNAQSQRLNSLSADLDLTALAQARKPCKRALVQFMQQRQIEPSAALVIGDQLFTDIWAANAAQVKSVLVERVAKQELWYIKPKRCLEALIKKIYGLQPKYDAILLEKNSDMR